MKVPYELVDKEAIKVVDLREYEEEIKMAVEDIFDGKVKVLVNKEEYILIHSLTDEEFNKMVRQLGKKISFYCPQLRKCRKVYHSDGCENGKSTQIFVRKKEKNNEK